LGYKTVHIHTVCNGLGNLLYSLSIIEKNINYLSDGLHAYL